MWVVLPNTYENYPNFLYEVEFMGTSALFPKESLKIVEEPIKFTVREVLSNFSRLERDTYSKVIGGYDTLEEAEKARKEHWKKLSDDALKEGKDVISKVVYIRKED